MEGELRGADAPVTRVLGISLEAVHFVSARPDLPERRTLVVAGGREGDQPSVAGPETVPEQPEVLLRLVAGELVDQRQRPAPGIQGVGVGGEHRHLAVGALAMDEPLGDPQLLAKLARAFDVAGQLLQELPGLIPRGRQDRHVGERGGDQVPERETGEQGGLAVLFREQDDRLPRAVEVFGEDLLLEVLNEEGASRLVGEEALREVAEAIEISRHEGSPQAPMPVARP